MEITIKIDIVDKSGADKDNVAMQTIVAQQQENAQKAREAAEAFFPNEEWIDLGNGIYSGRTRLDQSQKSKSEYEKFNREKEQAAILAERGSVIYFLPEINEQRKGAFNADCVIDGELTDLKKSGGNLKTIAKGFRKGIKQAKSVFLWITSSITSKQLYTKLSGEVAGKKNYGWKDYSLF